MTLATQSRRRSKRPSARAPAEQDCPYTMRLPDGRTIYVEVPGKWVTRDRSGEIAFLPQAVKLLDHIRVLAMSTLDRPPTPGYIRTLREALGLTQTQMGERVGVDKMTVARWEWGKVRPGRASLAALDGLRKAATRKGVVVPS